MFNKYKSLEMTQRRHKIAHEANIGQ
jgi:hypothetical protein